MTSAEDLAQWILIAILLMVAFSSLWSSISQTNLTKEVARQGGKLDLLEKTYIEVLQKTHDRLSDAMKEKP